MPPIISIVGRSNSGKTTLLEKLIAELKSRGYKIATVKHTHGELTPAESDKDSDRHLRAGSDAAIVTSPGRLEMVKTFTEELTLAQVAQLIGEDYDMILTEGFKEDDAPKIEVHRRENAPPLEGVSKIFAVATDEPLETKIRQFALEDIKPIADLIETGYIKPQQARLALVVNEQPLVLNAFTREFVENILLSITNSLKGAGKLKTLKIFMKKE
jgi:molybdopterin-guanine dinucleotide biosynthesis protein MobB